MYYLVSRKKTICEPESLSFIVECCVTISDEDGDCTCEHNSENQSHIEPAD